MTGTEITIGKILSKNTDVNVYRFTIECQDIMHLKHRKLWIKKELEKKGDKVKELSGWHD
jgi:hypothetical protein